MAPEPAAYAPGLKRMKRHNGRVDLYWVADEKLVRAGYRPKAVRLFGKWPSDEVASRCSILQAEMLEWAADRTPAQNVAEIGTVERVCRAFETDADPPHPPAAKPVRGANQMRRQPNIQEHFERGNAHQHPDCRATRGCSPWRGEEGRLTASSHTHDRGGEPCSGGRGYDQGLRFSRLKRPPEIFFFRSVSVRSSSPVWATRPLHSGCRDELTLRHAH